MKMRNLLFGVFLGLLAVVHSTPVLTLASTDVDREAETEEYLADEFLLPFLTTESPKVNATVPATQQPMSESKESDMTEGSGVEPMVPGGEHFATTTLTSTTTVLPVDATRAPQSGVTSPSEPDEALSTDNDAIEDTMVMSTTTVFILHGDELYESTTPSVPHAQSSTSTPFPMPSDDFSSHSSTTRAPQSGITSPSEPDEALSTDNDVIEDTTVMSTTTMFILHGDELYESTTPSAPHAQSSTSTPFPMPSDDFSSHSSTTRAPQSGFTSPSEPDEDLSKDNVSGDDNSVSQTTNTAVFSTYEGSGSNPDEGSGLTDLPGFISITTRSGMTSTSTAETSTTSATSKSGSEEKAIKDGRIFPMETVLTRSDVRELHNIAPYTPVSPNNAGHSTPAWIIIVGFIAGVAALVMLCVAIATRDKWNGPRQPSQAKDNPSNQQRELEMETFLHKDNPRENGKAAEYTVIPLDELPEKYSSH